MLNFTNDISKKCYKQHKTGYKIFEHELKPREWTSG